MAGANTNIQFYISEEIHISTADGDREVTFGTSTGIRQGLGIKYNINTVPLDFSITPAGFNWTNGVTTFTSSLNRIAAVEQAFSAVELPPNATTLEVIDTVLIQDDALLPTKTITLDASIPSIDILGAGSITATGGLTLPSVISFTNAIAPTCLANPQNSTDLCNKQYVDSQSALTAYQLYFNYSVPYTVPSGSTYSSLSQTQVATPTTVAWTTNSTSPVFLGGFFNLLTTLNITSIPAGVWTLLLFANLTNIAGQGREAFFYTLIGTASSGAETILYTSPASLLLNTVAPLIGSVSIQGTIPLISLTGYTGLGIKLYIEANSATATTGSVVYQTANAYSSILTSVLPISGIVNAATIDVTDTNTSATYYPTFVDSAGSAKSLRADIGTTPFSINPNTGDLRFGTSLKLNATQNNIAVGASAGLTTQGSLAVAVGQLAGQTSQGTSAVAIGYNAGNSSQGTGCVAVGISSGQSGQLTNSVAVGNNAGNSAQGTGCVAVGLNAGAGSQGTNGVAIGSSAGNSGQGISAVAIGRTAGQTTQGTSAVAIGNTAGTTSQGASSVAIGNSAGQNTQSAGAIAIGLNAGTTTQGASSVAIGYTAGQNTQGASSVAIGISAGTTTQGIAAVAIGNSCGNINQGTGAVAIGSGAGQGITTGQGANAIAIGALAGNSSQTAGSICLNASGVALNPNQIGCFIRPLRGVALGIGIGRVFYDTTTFELQYSTT